MAEHFKGSEEFGGKLIHVSRTPIDSENPDTAFFITEVWVNGENIMIQQYVSDESLDYEQIVLLREFDIVRIVDHFTGGPTN